jgi:hypothetical protein
MVDYSLRNELALGFRAYMVCAVRNLRPKAALICNDKIVMRQILRWRYVFWWRKDSAQEAMNQRWQICCKKKPAEAGG